MGNCSYRSEDFQLHRRLCNDRKKLAEPIVVLRYILTTDLSSLNLQCRLHKHNLIKAMHTMQDL